MINQQLFAYHINQLINQSVGPEHSKSGAGIGTRVSGPYSILLIATINLQMLICIWIDAPASLRTTIGAYIHCGGRRADVPAFRGWCTCYRPWRLPRWPARSRPENKAIRVKSIPRMTPSGGEGHGVRPRIDSTSSKRPRRAQRRKAKLSALAAAVRSSPCAGISPFALSMSILLRFALFPLLFTLSLHYVCMHEERVRPAVCSYAYVCVYCSGLN